VIVLASSYVFSLLSLDAAGYIVKFYRAPELIAARQLFARISLRAGFLNGDFYCPHLRARIGKVSVLFIKQRTLKKEML
jgi:hypothetical protein